MLNSREVRAGFPGSNPEQDQGCRDLPCVSKLRVYEDFQSTTTMLEFDGAVMEGTLEVKATPNKDVLENGREHLIEHPGTRPLAVAAVAGLVGGKFDSPLANGQIVPRFVGRHAKNACFGIQRTHASASKERMLRHPKNACFGFQSMASKTRRSSMGGRSRPRISAGG